MSYARAVGPAGYRSAVAGDHAVSSRRGTALPWRRQTRLEKGCGLDPSHGLMLWRTASTASWTRLLEPVRSISLATWVCTVVMLGLPRNGASAAAPDLWQHPLSRPVVPGLLVDPVFRNIGRCPAPHPEKLRVTVQTVGGGSQRVTTDGPYGTLTDDIRRFPAWW